MKTLISVIFRINKMVFESIVLYEANFIKCFRVCKGACKINNYVKN